MLVLSIVGKPLENPSWSEAIRLPRLTVTITDGGNPETAIVLKCDLEKFLETLTDEELAKISGYVENEVFNRVEATPTDGE